jgi:hypothetical protein
VIALGRVDFAELLFERPFQLPIFREELVAFLGKGEDVLDVGVELGLEMVALFGHGGEQAF